MEPWHSLPEPRRFIRRSRRAADAPRRTQQTVLAPAFDPQHDSLHLAGHPQHARDQSRARYNRIVGRLNQEEYDRTSHSEWPDSDVDRIANIFVAYQASNNHNIRATVLQNDLNGCEPPNFDLLEIPDQNEYGKDSSSLQLYLLSMFDERQSE